jgi:hypothetical protein
VLENTIGSCNTITKVVLSALSTGMNLTGAARYENSHRNDRPSTTTVSTSPLSSDSTNGQQLSLMHYLPSDVTGNKKVGHQKHKHISSLTLLFNEQWGLQIRPPGSCGARE